MKTQSVKSDGRLQLVTQATGPADLAAKVKAVGLKKVQLGLTAHRGDYGAWDGVQEILAADGIAIASGMFSTIGEDYSTPETIRLTGGIVPDQHWEENWDLACNAAKLASGMGLTYVMSHVGFLPHDHSDPTFEKLVGRIVDIAKMFNDYGLVLDMETGQETAETLFDFIGELDSRGVSNVGINFDPANMIMYDMDEPIKALRQLVPYVHGVHAKDALRPAVKGDWGSEVVVGTGEVDWNAFVDILVEADFAGDYIFEREAGDDRIGDIAAGIAKITSVIQK